MKTIVAILFLSLSGAALAETAADQPIKVYKGGKLFIYDSARQQYRDDRLRSHRLQETQQPGASEKTEKKDRGLGIG